MNNNVRTGQDRTGQDRTVRIPLQKISEDPNLEEQQCTEEIKAAVLGVRDINVNTFFQESVEEVCMLLLENVPKDKHKLFVALEKIRDRTQHIPDFLFFKNNNKECNYYQEIFTESKISLLESIDQLIRENSIGNISLEAKNTFYSCQKALLDSARNLPDSPIEEVVVDARKGLKNRFH